MKKGMFLVIGLLLLCGCSSTNPVAEPVDPAKLNRAQSIVKDAIPYIKASASAAIKLSLQYAEKDEEKRDKLQFKIYTVAAALEGLLSKGDYRPASVTKALQVKEDYVDGILQAVGVIYEVSYDSLVKNENADLAIQILKALAEGVKAGTAEHVLMQKTEIYASKVIQVEPFYYKLELE